MALNHPGILVMQLLLVIGGMFGNGTGCDYLIFVVE
jgi:hypothetical protein